MEYIMSLRTYFNNKYPDYSVSGNIYYGYMDMTYFSFFPDSLKKRKLKAGIVFLHDSCKFEVWLFGYNKKIQAKYWELLKESEKIRVRSAEQKQGERRTRLRCSYHGSGCRCRVSAPQSCQVNPGRMQSTRKRRGARAGVRWTAKPCQTDEAGGRMRPCCPDGTDFKAQP